MIADFIIFKLPLLRVNVPCCWNKKNIIYKSFSSFTSSIIVGNILMVRKLSPIELKKGYVLFKFCVESTFLDNHLFASLFS